ncbi:MAG: hypothetical protein WCR27_09935 [Eubacteriales bacterium]
MKNKSFNVLILILIFFSMLLSGCVAQNTTTPKSSENSCCSDDSEFRTFAVGDTFPYDKKENCIISNKNTGAEFSLYIYVITNGGSWKDNDVRNISVTYIDENRPEETTVFNDINNSNSDNTYIRVDKVSYDLDARGHFSITGEIQKNKNKWEEVTVLSNSFNFGNPTVVNPPISKDNIMYEKEVVVE